MGPNVQRQSRSRQKISKTAIHQNNSVGSGGDCNSDLPVNYPPPAQQANPYDNSSTAGAPSQSGIFQSQNGRNTFYVSDTQRQKQSLFKEITSNKVNPHPLNPPNGGARLQGNHYFAGAGHSATRQVQRIQWNGPRGQQQLQQMHS